MPVLRSRSFCRHRCVFWFFLPDFFNVCFTCHMVETVFMFCFIHSSFAFVHLLRGCYCRGSRSMKCILLTFVNTRLKCIVLLYSWATLFFRLFFVVVVVVLLSVHFTLSRSHQIRKGIIIDWYNKEMYFHNIKWNSYHYSYCYALWISFYKRK